MITVTINGLTLKWYTQKGYIIPKTPIQVYCKNRNGRRIKNGIEYRVVRGTTLMVREEDLPPSSNEIIRFICEKCEKTCTTTWSAFKKKQSRKCRDCKKADIKGTGCHTYWVNRLITMSSEAKCDISEENDKRFLVLHHLHSEGYNTPENYVTLSANYHLAFHKSMGGTGVPCTAADYYFFKEKELINKQSKNESFT